MDDNIYATEPELSNYLEIARRRWGWILIPILLGLSLAITSNVSGSPSYQATSRVLVGSSAAQESINSGSQSISYLARELSNEIALATGDNLRAEVEDRLGFVPNVKVTGDNASDILNFTGIASDRDASAEHANTWAQAYIDAKQDEATASIELAVASFTKRLADLRVQRQDVRKPLDELDDRIASNTSETLVASLQLDRDRLAQDLAPELNVIDSQIAAVATSVALLELDGDVASLGTARILQVANPPANSTKAPLARTAALALLVGSVLGAGLALLRETLDRTIKNADDLGRVTKLPLLASIPLADSALTEQELALIVRDHDLSPVSDGYFKARSALQFALIGQGSQTILVTSPSQSEGKSATSSNLAWALATIGKRVALADVDFRRPRQHVIHGVSQEPGLSNHIVSGIPMHQLTIDVDTQGHDLVILPAGSAPPRPADFIASEAFNDSIRALAKEADVVILDAPPVLPVADSLNLARIADHTIVCVRAGATTKDQLRMTIDSLGQVGAEIIGIILIGVKQRGPGYGYYQADDTTA